MLWRPCVTPNHLAVLLNGGVCGLLISSDLLYSSRNSICWILCVWLRRVSTLHHLLCAKTLCILSTHMNESLSYIICNKRIKVLNAYLKVSINCAGMSQGLSLWHIVPNIFNSFGMASHSMWLSKLACHLKIYWNFFVSFLL